MHSTASDRLVRTSVSALSGLLTGALIAMASLPAPADARTTNRGLEPVHQPVVQRTDFVFDAVADGAGGLSAIERGRLVGWLDAIRLGYGDRVSIVASGYERAALLDAIGDIVGRYGLLVSGNAPRTAGDPQAGAVRVVVSRSTATVEGCPTWRDKAEADFTSGLSDNYGCAMANNLAAMIADPQDLVEGRSSPDLRTWIGSRAIKTYRDQAPTGAGGLKSESAGG